MKLSVVIPSYNHELFIGEAIKSVLSQTESDFELIIVDDGSSDDSIDIIKSFKDPRLLLFEQANQGAHHAINRGLSLAKGQYLAILNSDDRFHKDRFRKVMDVFDANPNTHLVTTWISIIDSKGKILGKKRGWRDSLPWAIPDEKASFFNSDSFEKNLLISNFVSTTSNMIFRREVFEKIGGMRSLRFAHDWDFLFRCVHEFNCQQVDDFLLDYRVHQNNTITKNRNEMILEILLLWAAHLPRLANKNLFSSANHEKTAQNLKSLFASVNTQGNDKVMFLIKTYLDYLAQSGATEPEILLLNTPEVKTSFIELIV